MTSNDWQERVLTDEELQAVLGKLGALEGMQVLQRQLALRSAQHEDAPQLRNEVSNHLELGLTGFIPTVEQVSESEPTEGPITEAEEQPQASSVSDIAGNLNALFASRQHVEFEPAPALEISAVEHNLSYAPITLESDTKSFFIPTFANPLPDTQSVEVVTPIAQHMGESQPASVEDRVAAIEPVVETADQPSVEPVVEVAEVPVDEAVVEFPAVPAVEPFAVTEGEAGVAAPADLASAEEAVTAYEEADTTSTAQPNLVDDVILAVGGEADTAEQPVAIESAPNITPVPDVLPITGLVPVEERALPAASISVPTTDGKSGFGALLATWNGTGNLLFLIAAGFTAASLKFNLVTVLAGAFGALATAGFGFGTAALSARRGRQPQATISRAAFGVRGAVIPLIFVMLAKYAATAFATIATVFALAWFYPSLPKTISIGGLAIDSFYLLLVLVLLVAAIVTILGSAARFVVTLVVALGTAIWALGILGTTAALSPASFNLGGGIDAGKALAFASALVILLSVVWGTTAADETPNLRNEIVAPKLLAAGLASHAIVGSVAVLSGYAYYNLDLVALKGEAMGVLFTVAAVLALSHQIRRSADSFSGFGLAGTRWWVIVLSALLVALAGVSGHLFVDESSLKSGAISLLPVAGVPVVAWLAIFGVDSVLRRDDYHEISLLRDYGFYGRVCVNNLAGWVLAVAVGLGFVRSDVPGFTWLGYLAGPLGFSVTGSQADAGVWIAFAIGLLAPLTTLGRIRDQEAEGRALQDRHKELINVLGEL